MLDQHQTSIGPTSCVCWVMLPHNYMADFPAQLIPFMETKNPGRVERTPCRTRASIWIYVCHTSCWYIESRRARQTVITPADSSLLPSSITSSAEIAETYYYLTLNDNIVDLVIFSCLNFREFLFLGHFTKFRIREFSFFLSIAIIMIIFAGFSNSRIFPSREN